jgi:hypothetical protein
MHEFELGVWKALLIHLVRILHSLGSQHIQEFNSQYVVPNFLNLHHPKLSVYLSFRQITPFGRSSIRRFTHNVTDMKKLATRDFKDILQVICFMYVQVHVY